MTLFVTIYIPYKYKSQEKVYKYNILCVGKTINFELLIFKFSFDGNPTICCAPYFYYNI